MIRMIILSQIHDFYALLCRMLQVNMDLIASIEDVRHFLLTGNASAGDARLRSLLRAGGCIRATRRGRVCMPT